jgi:uncharacterized membrane protein
MGLFDRFKRGELRLGRIEAFSDGVFAIIVTLLVLDLKVPPLKDASSVAELSHALIEQLPRFLSWLISFIIVCKFWLNHHHVLGMARHADYGLVWINSIFLMGQSFIPFPTAMIGEYHGNRLAVALFGGVFALNTALFIVLQTYIQRRLLKPELADQQDPNLFAKSLIGIVFYLAGAALAWVSIPAAFVIYMITPWFFITPPQYRSTTTANGQRRFPREGAGD